MKLNMVRNIYVANGYMETIISFMRRAIPKENTQFRLIVKLASIIRPEVRPISRSKCLQKFIICLGLKKTFNWGMNFKNWRRELIYKKIGRPKGMGPKIFWAHEHEA